MTKEVIKPGKFVSLTYTISDSEGNLLEQNDIPVNYVHGGDTELIGGMDRAVTGKSAGDRIEMDILEEDGFGAHDPNLTFTDDVDNVPPQFRHLSLARKSRCRTSPARRKFSMSPILKTENSQSTVTILWLVSVFT